VGGYGTRIGGMRRAEDVDSEGPVAVSRRVQTTDTGLLAVERESMMLANNGRAVGDV
jgi:hypothetical protein